MLDPVQGARSVGGRNHDVLEARTPLSGHVDAGLDGEGVAWFEEFGVARDEVGILVGLDADAMTRAVDKVLAEAARGDAAPGDRVDILTALPHSRRRDGRLLRVEEHRVQLTELLRRLADPHAPGDIRAVANSIVTEHGATEVAQHDLIALDNGRPGFVVRRGCVGPRRDDGEVHPLVSLSPQASTDVGRHLGLGATDQGDVTRLELRGHPIGGGASPSQRLDLRSILHRPQGSHHLARPPEAGGRETIQQVDKEARPRLITDSRGTRTVRECGHDLDGIVGLVPRPQCEHVGTLDDPRRLEAGHDKGGITTTGYDQHRETLERHRFVAAQPRQVSPHREQQNIDVSEVHGLANPPHAIDEGTGHAVTV